MDSLPPSQPGARPEQPPPPHHHHHFHPHHRQSLSSSSDYRPRLPSDAFAAPPLPPPPGIGPGINGGAAVPVMPARSGFAASQQPQHMSRSPPTASAQGSKNTKHVPCKFYRQGTCTAGDACPYSHADSAILEPCKFFLNGNCKYGSRCALPHVVNGRVMNPQCLNPNAGSRGGRNGHQHHHQQAYGMVPPPAQPAAFFPAPPEAAGMPIPAQPGARVSRDFGVSPAGSGYGSPARDGRLGPSPQIQGFSALDTTLPASYNSQDLPNAIKTGPHATSVPVKTGWGPLTSSSPTTSTTAAYANLDTLAKSDARDLAASPPAPSHFVEPRRILFASDRNHNNNNNNNGNNGSNGVSASVPVHQHETDALSSFKPGRPVPGRAEDDDDDAKGEEYIPSSLSDLLTDREKLRRFSRSEEERPAGVGRTSISSVGSPSSPSHASPSRFGAFFASQKKEKSEQASHPGSSPFGHVGSPLRSSSISMATGKPRDFSGSPSFGPISPPRSTDRSQFVSSLSEQLKGMGLNPTTRPDGSDHLPPPVMRAPQQSSLNGPAAQRRDARSGTIGTVGRDKTDEEEGLFSMDDIREDGTMPNGKRSLDTPRRFADVAAVNTEGNK